MLIRLVSVAAIFLSVGVGLGFVLDEDGDVTVDEALAIVREALGQDGDEALSD